MSSDKPKISRASVLRLIACQALCIYNNGIIIQKNFDEILKIINDNFIEVYLNEENSKRNNYKTLYKTKFIKELLTNVVSKQEEIDKVLVKELRNFNTIDNLLDTTRESFRLAIYEMLNFADVPAEVIINEYTDIIAELSNDTKETKFANKILDNLTQTIRHKNNKKEINNKKIIEKPRQVLSLAHKK